MIRVLSGGYTKEDFEFLKKLLRDSLGDVHNKCSKENVMCVWCPNRRACLDVSEVIDYLERGDRK